MPGELVGDIMVDVGTGYYCSKTPKEAGEYFARKKTFVAGELQKLESAINQKQGQKRVLGQVLEQKIAIEQRQQQKADEQ